jgi:hypothetical protein
LNNSSAPVLSGINNDSIKSREITWDISGCDLEQFQQSIRISERDGVVCPRKLISRK